MDFPVDVCHGLRGDGRLKAAHVHVVEANVRESVGLDASTRVPCSQASALGAKEGLRTCAGGVDPGRVHDDDGNVAVRAGGGRLDDGVEGMD